MGARANLNFYFRVYMLQAVLAAAVAYPLYLVHYYKSDISFGTVLDILGSVLFIVGFLLKLLLIFKKMPLRMTLPIKVKSCNKVFGNTLVILIILGGVTLVGNLLYRDQCCSWYYAIFGPLLIHFLLLRFQESRCLRRSMI